MTFEKALEAMRFGKRVRLPHWTPTAYVRIVNGKLRLRWLRESKRAVTVELQGSEILSNAWEVV